MAKTKMQRLIAAVDRANKARMKEVTRLGRKAAKVKAQAKEKADRARKRKKGK